MRLLSTAVLQGMPTSPEVVAMWLQLTAEVLVLCTLKGTQQWRAPKSSSDGTSDSTATAAQTAPASHVFDLVVLVVVGGFRSVTSSTSSCLTVRPQAGRT